MIDYGLFALIVVILTLIFLAFHAWRGIKSEGERISAQSRQVDAAVADLVHQIQRIRVDAEDAKRVALEVQGTHYKALLRRIDEAEATSLGAIKQCEVLAEKVASQGGRLSALARWQKKDPDPAPAAADDDTEQLPMFPAAPVPPPGNMHVTGHFGRPAARKVG